MTHMRFTLIGIIALFGVGLLTGCAGEPSATHTPVLSTPEVPPELSVPSHQRLSLRARGVGFQIYTCRATPGRMMTVPGNTDQMEAPSYAWTLKGPEATLLNENGLPIGKHYAGPTWEMNDGSRVVAVAQASLATPDGTGIPWLLLKAVRNEGVGALGAVRTIQRAETVGGNAPTSGCNVATQDNEVRIAYEATYYFYVGNA